MISAPIHHIGLDERGVAYLVGTKTKVATIAIDATTWGMDPEQIRQNYPHLTLGQVHAALGYYFDHRDDMDRQIAEWDEEYKQLQAAKPNLVTRQDFEARLKEGRTSGA